MIFAKFFAVFAAIAMVMVSVVQAMDKEDTFIIGGSHGCGPKLLLKSGSKKKGDILLMNNDCKGHSEYKHPQYIPYPVYHSYGGYGHGGQGGYGHGGY